MSWLKFILRSARYYFRQYLGLFLGTALSAAVLVGALLAGDSVKYSLLRFVRLRLGHIEYVLEQSERYFTTDLARFLASSLKTHTAPVLRLRGTVTENRSGLKVNDIQILGVDESFWKMSPQPPPFSTIDSDQALLNARLAKRLNVKAGDQLVLLLEKIDSMPKDTPFSAGQDTRALHLRVQSVVADEHLGRFSLNSNQVSPLTVFVPIRLLQQKTNLGAKANLMLIAERTERALQAPELAQALDENISLSDMGLMFVEDTGGRYFDLLSQRVFIESAVEQAVGKINVPSQPVLTYFVNSISLDRSATPYSFVSAPGPPLVPPTLKEDEIVISRWLAEDLNARRGDRIKLSYYVPAALNILEEHTSFFTVHSIIAREPAADERLLMPQFSGLSDVENCRDWHPGIDIDLSRIRKKDEEYWDLYRGTPKAYITLSAAQKLWQNRFGKVTAVRFSTQETDTASVRQELLKNITPAALGFMFRPVRSQGLKASREAVDFGQLFLGLSFFIIVSALLLSALFFAFHRQSRNPEAGILKAVGIPVRTIKQVAMAEGAGIALVGSCLGVVLGVLYSYLLVMGLNTIWQGAVGETALILFINPFSLLSGCIFSFCAAVFFLWLALKNQLQKQISLLQSNILQFNPPLPGGNTLLSFVMGLICVFGTAGLILLSFFHQELTVMIFFFSGGLMLCAFMLLFNALLNFSARSRSREYPGLFAVGYKNIARRKHRSLLTTGLLAVGIFCVIAVGVNQQELPANPAEPSSGTGGFMYYAETTLPVIDNLNRQSVRKKLHLDDDSLAGASYVQLRVRPGDDASCLNLNHTAAPRVLGVDPNAFARTNSFSFAAVHRETKGKNPWLALTGEPAENVVPAIADQTVITWGLGMSIGDELSYINERGEEIKLKLIAGLHNSIFQGSILISEKNFTTHFPSVSGYRVVLIQGIPPAERTTSLLSASLSTYGIDLHTTTERLARFHVVENTYLLMFLILGGLGLLTGTVGFGVIILRNVAESRNEYALLKAVGFNNTSIALLILSEQLTLLLAGIVCGTLSAFIALIPHFTKNLPQVPFSLTVIILFTLLASGIFWSYLGTKTALKGNLVDVLHEE